MGPARGERRRVGRAAAVVGEDAEESEDAEGVFFDARGGIADEAHAAGVKVLEAAGRVVEGAAGIEVQRVEGEVAALGIGDPVAGERDTRLAAQGLDVHAQGGDLIRAVARDGSDGAVVDSGGDRLQARRNQQGGDVGGDVGGGDVDIVDRTVEQRVTHTATDEAHGGPLGGERRDYRAGFGRRHPRLGIDSSRGCHRVQLLPGGRPRPALNHRIGLAPRAADPPAGV